MLPSTLNNRLAVRQYLDGFERRFTETPDGTLFLEEDGSAVRLPDEEAARLIATMRATLYEADAATPLGGLSVGWAMAGAAGGAVLLGWSIGLPGLGCALALPAAASAFLLGPGLGAFRLDAAWRHGLDRARAAMTSFERVEGGEARSLAPVNRVRPVLEALSFLTASVILGLILAYVTMPFYARVGMDRALAEIAPPVLLAIVVLVFAARVREATTRRRVSEAAIADVWAEGRRRPFR